MAVDAGRERRLGTRRKRPDVLSIVGVAFVVGIALLLLVNLVDDPAQFFNVALIGLTTGCVYALVALGYTLVYGILQLINFAHGDVFALCGLVSSSIMISLFNLNGSEAVGVIAIGLAGTII